MVFLSWQTCMGKDATLHVSASNSAMLLYQKFGFKTEEYILDFYDKYYPLDSKECKHAFFLRLRRWYTEFGGGLTGKLVTGWKFGSELQLLQKFVMYSLWRSQVHGGPLHMPFQRQGELCSSLQGPLSLAEAMDVQGSPRPPSASYGIKKLISNFTEK